MGRFSKLSTLDLIKGIKDTDLALIRANDSLKTLSRPKTLPHAHAAKLAMIESTEKLIVLLQKDEKQLSAELAKRGPQ